MIHGHAVLVETVLVDQGQDRAEMAKPTQPETQLWQAVVLQAWHDATKATGCNTEDRRTAHLFLSGATEEWRRARAWVCEHAEIDERMLARMYAKRLREHLANKM